MLPNYSTVYENTLRKLNSQAYFTKTYHGCKPLHFGTFVLKKNFSYVHFSDKLKPLRIGPYKILDRLSEVTYELLSKYGSTLHVRRNHLILYFPKEPLLYHICVISCASQTQSNLTFQNQLKRQIVTPPLLIWMNRYPTKYHHKNLLYHQQHLITILKLLSQLTAHLSNYMTTHLSKR